MFRVLVITIFALSLAGCQTIAPSSCPGWTKPPQANDPVALTVGENQIARYLIKTDRFGIAQGCWK